MTNALRRIRRAVSGAAIEDRRSVRRVDPAGYRTRVVASPVLARYAMA